MGASKFLISVWPNYDSRLPGGDSTQTVATHGSTESVILGTAGYMSPEQARGQAADHRSDIFSFGAMLYEMVSGRRAFEGESAIETLSAVLKHDPPELSATDASITPPLSSVIQHCLEKEPNQRFQSARDLAFALARLSGSSTSGAVAPLSTRRSRRRLWIIGSAAALLLAVAVGTAAYMRRPPLVASQPSFRQLTFRRGHIATARFAPDGQTVISNASWDGKPFEIASTRLDTAESTALPLSGASLVSVSRFGDLAVFVKEGIIARVPIGGSGTRDLLDRVRDADWAPDGELAVIRNEGAADVGRIPARQIHLRTNRDIHQRHSCVPRRQAHRSPRADAFRRRRHVAVDRGPGWSGHQAVAEVGIERARQPGLDAGWEGGLVHSGRRRGAARHQSTR